MNRQPHRLPPTGKPALKTSTTNLVTQAESGISNFDLPALTSMRRTASPSRPYGRYAVGLRPSPDPDAYFDAPNQDKEVRRINQNDTAVGLDRPRSFRNELRIHSVLIQLSTGRHLWFHSRLLTASKTP
jgi:hypothetical protein